MKSIWHKSRNTWKCVMNPYSKWHMEIGSAYPQFPCWSLHCSQALYNVSINTGHQCKTCWTDTFYSFKSPTYNFKFHIIWNGFTWVYVDRLIWLVHLPSLYWRWLFLILPSWRLLARCHTFCEATKWINEKYTKYKLWCVSLISSGIKTIFIY